MWNQFHFTPNPLSGVLTVSFAGDKYRTYFCVFIEASTIDWKHVLCSGSLLDTEKTETWILAFTHRFTAGKSQQNIKCNRWEQCSVGTPQSWLWPRVEARVTIQECSAVTWVPFLRLSGKAKGELGGGARKEIPALRITSRKPKEITWRSGPSWLIVWWVTHRILVWGVWGKLQSRGQMV